MVASANRGPSGPTSRPDAVATRRPALITSPSAVTFGVSNGECLDQVDLEFQSRIGPPGGQGGVHGAAHGRVEQRGEDPAMDRTDRVVEMLTHIEAERDLARIDALNAHAEESGNRRTGDRVRLPIARR